MKETLQPKETTASDAAINKGVRLFGSLDVQKMTISPPTNEIDKDKVELSVSHQLGIDLGKIKNR